MTVVSSDVKAILQTKLTDLTPFILAAEQVSAQLPSSVTVAQKFEIERWLAAHFAIMMTESGGIRRDRANQDEAEYARFEGAGLRGSRYGVQALILDPSGTLERLDKPAVMFRVAEQCVNDRR